jgi:hypothetical protein
MRCPVTIAMPSLMARLHTAKALACPLICKRAAIRPHGVAETYHSPMSLRQRFLAEFGPIWLIGTNLQQWK